MASINQPDFYRAFEDRYRGSRELIRSRLEIYKAFVAPLLEAAVSIEAIDVGCGRGEWLELAGQWGFMTYGADLSEQMLQECWSRGLNATHTDALTALEGVADNSVALVSAFHLVEHIPFDDVRRLISAAYRVLCPGGLLILETPNPENLVVGATSFYLDPTHIRPLPPLLLSFATEHAGFARNKIVRLQQPSLPLRGLGVADVFSGVSPDYSVVCQKSAGPSVLAMFDGAFAKDYGISLNSLAQLHDRQREEMMDLFNAGLARADNAETRTRTAESQAAEVMMRAREAELSLEKERARADNAESRTKTAESHAAQAIMRAREAELSLEKERARAAFALAWATSVEIKAEQTELLLKNAIARATAAENAVLFAEQVKQQLYESTSWKVTRPLRVLGRPILRITSAVRQGRVSRGLLRRLGTNRIASKILAWSPNSDAQLPVVIAESATETTARDASPIAEQSDLSLQDSAPAWLDQAKPLTKGTS